jgi:hypothetical protein
MRLPLGTPLLPIAIFGGAAGALWTEFKHLYGPELFTPEERQHLFTEWGKNSTSSLISALKKVYAKNPFSRGPRRLWLIATICVVALLLAWMVVSYFGNNVLSLKYPAILLLTLISAMMGTTLRQIVRMRHMEPLEVDVKLIATDALAGVLIAFGLLISFYMATVLVTGSASAATDNFGRLSFAVTLLGMGAGLLLEKSEKTLTSRLGAVLGDRHLQEK